MGAVDYLTLRVKGEDYFRIPLEKKVTVIRAINNEHCSMINYLFQRLKDKASTSKGIMSTILIRRIFSQIFLNG